MAKAMAQFTIIDFNDIYASNTAPTNPAINQIWLDISIVPNRIKKWDGTSWNLVGASSLAELDDIASDLLNNNASAINDLSGVVAGKADTSDLDDINNTLTAYEEKIAKLTTRADGVDIDVSQIFTRVGSNEDSIETMNTHFNFDINGLTIGKQDSPLNITISNDQMNFVDNQNIVAYINGQKMYINSLEVLQSLIVGVHKIEKYDANTTLIKWVG